MYKGLLILTLLATLFTACKNDKAPKAGDILDENYEPIVPSATTQNTPPAAAGAPDLKEPAQNAKGVWHYTCPKGCKGGAGLASPCGECGTTLVHNTVYHDNNAAGTPSVGGTPGAIGQPTVKTVTTNGQASATSATVGTITSPIMSGEGFSSPNQATGINMPLEIKNSDQAVTVPPKKVEPPQNAAGVWHYTCNAGCAGGAGSAVACAGCGNLLVHNSAYHK